MKKLTIVVIILTSMTYFTVSDLLAEAQQHHGSYSLSWSNDNFTGNDKPYAAARQHIDLAISQGTRPETLLPNIQKQSQNQPHSILAQFSYAYVVYQMVNKPTFNQTLGSEMLSKLIQPLEMYHSPHAYNYTRLLFLICSYRFPPAQLRQVGERLLERDSNDAEVKYALASIMDESESTNDRQTAMAYARQLIQENPNNAKYQGLMAGILYTVWHRSRTQADANNAIAAYQKYLQVAGPNDTFRRNAEIITQYIQQQQAEINGQHG